MEHALLDILDQLRRGGFLGVEDLAKIIRQHNAGIRDNARRTSKKKLLRFYFETKNDDPDRWTSWDIDDNLESLLLRTLRAKPRRTASGVATITVITKPWPCEGNCVFCPNDLRMPKSYVHNEPACQRAERNFFDPYLQVTSRLRALTQMGHITDKVELIVLGGSWTTYPEDYQRWFVARLFEALNDAGRNAEAEQTRKEEERVADASALEATDPSSAASLKAKSTRPPWPNLAEQKAATIRDRYHEQGFSTNDNVLSSWVAAAQAEISNQQINYNQGFSLTYGADSRWIKLAADQKANWSEVERQQRLNETAKHRCVGLVVETRPDAIDEESLAAIRRLGCTKVQIGVQSCNEALLSENGRQMPVESITRAFELLRLFGFKVHTHFMANLLGATPEQDAEDYRTFVTDPRFRPDEVKLYPCVLLGGTKLQQLHNEGRWHGYGAKELTWLMTKNLLTTQPYTRVSRMIRDFSAQDIIEGNRTANLRQLVESIVQEDGGVISEIRHREVASARIDANELSLDVIAYDTTATQERFLQWVTPSNAIAGFLRLSTPKSEAIKHYGESLVPVKETDAMIREVHVYGKVERLHEANEGTQHLGLGRKLVQRACEIAREEGRTRILVISAVGTREYYRKLGFVDEGLYQAKTLY